MLQKLTEQCQGHATRRRALTSSQPFVQRLFHLLNKQVSMTSIVYTTAQLWQRLRELGDFKGVGQIEATF